MAKKMPKAICYKPVDEWRALSAAARRRIARKRSQANPSSQEGSNG